RGEAQRELAECGTLARDGDLGGERLEVGAEALVRVQRTAERLHLAFPALVRLDPARVALRLAQRLPDVRLEPLRLERPRAEKRLVDEQLLAPVRAAVVCVQLAPRERALGEAVGHACEHADARADV